MNIAFYLKLKAERRPVRNHPVIARIAALRENIQKMKSAETKLFDQLEQVLGVLKMKGQPARAQDGIRSEVKQSTNDSAENGTSKKVQVDSRTAQTVRVYIVHTIHVRILTCSTYYTCTYTDIQYIRTYVLYMSTLNILCVHTILRVINLTLIVRIPHSTHSMHCSCIRI